MEKLNDKQRQIIRLAFQSKNKELRKKAAQRIMEARYKEEFMEWALAQGEAFTNPDTGNKVRFKSLKSQPQKEVFRRWEAGEYEDRGGPPPGGGDGGGGGGGGADDGGREEGGGKYADRKEIRSKPWKGMDDRAGITDDDLVEWFGDNQFEGRDDFKNVTFADLDRLDRTVSLLLGNPDHPWNKSHPLVTQAKLDRDGLKKMGRGVRKKMNPARGRKYHSKVLELANQYELESEDVDAIHQFRLDKPPTGRKLSPAELQQKFLQGEWARHDPEIRERVSKMSPEDFMAMRNSVLLEAEEDEELMASMGKAGGEEEVEEEESITMFEEPPANGKKGKLSEAGRRLVRLAYTADDPRVREGFMRRLKAEITSQT